MKWLTWISPVSLSSPFFQTHSFQFMYEASGGEPLSPLIVSLLSLLAGRTLNSRLSLFSFLSVSTTWSLGPIFPRAAQVSFGSISTRCPRGSWDACHVCPHPGLSAIITRRTRWNRLLKSNQSISRVWEAALLSLFRPPTDSTNYRKWVSNSLSSW